MLQVRDLKNAPLGPVSFDLHDDEIVVISGSSGSGKSLLLRAVADLDPTEGQVSLEGVDRTQIPPPLWRRRVGLLPADCAWWGSRVGDSFDASNDVVGLAELGFKPEVLDWEIERLSTGEAQRLGLLRLLANEPRILLLDEPTANLDPDNTLAVEALVARYRSDRKAAVLWVCHDPAQQQRLGARVLKIVDGRLRA